MLYNSPTYEGEGKVRAKSKYPACVGRGKPLDYKVIITKAVIGAAMARM